MFHGDQDEISKRGGYARAEALTSEQRSLIAQKGAYKRWYKSHSDDMERLNACLRMLAGVVHRAYQKQDDNLLVRAITAMAPYERMKIVFSKGETGKPVDELEDLGKEASRRFEQGRKAREMEGETVIDDKDKPEVI